jgi:adenylate cyclase
VSFEIERKFLVANDAWRAGATEHSRLCQAYLTSEGKASIRVRIKDNRDASLSSRAVRSCVALNWDIRSRPWKPKR